MKTMGSYLDFVREIQGKGMKSDMLLRNTLSLKMI